MASYSGDPDDVRPSRAAFWNDPVVRGIFWQVVVVGIVVALAAFLVSNTLANLARQNIASGFGFFDQESGFAIGEAIIPFAPTQTYLRALVVGLLNTIKVAVAGIVFATLIGTLVGIMRLSPNWLMARIATVYVETLRNIPLLLQLFFWYALIVETLPPANQAIGPVLGFYLSNRGLNVPVPNDWAYLGPLVGFLLAIVASVILLKRSRRLHDATGQTKPVLLPSIGIVIVFILLGWAATGFPLTIDTPALTGFSFKGGIVVSSEFLALWLGLTLYTATFIAEIVRSGIQAVDKGQWEAAGALGLKRGQILRFVVLPQSLRVIIPPLTSQYLNLTKNSSLAVAIGYPDIVSVANTTMNQTGQAIEGIAVIMTVYLSLSLSISAFMNWYNKRIALVER
ncbi:MAG: amino acid ABC transporter permease [Hyphomicrobiales bacterium]|nr:MAG: amino acid ABC transporter permease [Hyphomicrobiales bacterium]